MATNKERIESLEAGLSGLQEGMNCMELGIVDKLHHLEEMLRSFKTHPIPPAIVSEERIFEITVTTILKALMVDGWCVPQKSQNWSFPNLVGKTLWSASIV